MVIALVLRSASTISTSISSLTVGSTFLSLLSLGALSPSVRLLPGTVLLSELRHRPSAWNPTDRHHTVIAQNFHHCRLFFSVPSGHQHQQRRHHCHRLRPAVAESRVIASCFPLLSSIGLSRRSAVLLLPPAHSAASGFLHWRPFARRIAHRLTMDVNRALLVSAHQGCYPDSASPRSAVRSWLTRLRASLSGTSRD